MMKLNKMTLREQIIVLVAFLVIIGGAYGAFRFYPANQKIIDIKKNTQMMDVAIKTGKVPEEPFESAADLKLDLADLETELVNTRNMITGVEQRLVIGDTTEVRLAISEVARKALVRINLNEQYLVTVPPQPGAATTLNPQATQKRLGDAAQRRARNARRASRTAGAMASVNQVSPEQATALIRKMAVNGPMERPMQRLSMEGTYAAVMNFIQGLDEMDKMATILQLQLIPVPQAPPPGYNQRLTVTMVLAL